jgi:hypothetical protein
LKTFWWRTIHISTHNTHRDQPSNMIPHDNDHVNDPRVLSWSFTASQPNKNYSNHAKNATWRRGMNLASNMKIINMPQTWAW